jgi:hypothetical protein
MSMQPRLSSGARKPALRQCLGDKTKIPPRTIGRLLRQALSKSSSGLKSTSHSPACRIRERTTKRSCIPKRLDFSAPTSARSPMCNFPTLAVWSQMTMTKLQRLQGSSSLRAKTRISRSLCRHWPREYGRGHLRCDECRREKRIRMLNPYVLSSSESASASTRRTQAMEQV